MHCSDESTLDQTVLNEGTVQIYNPLSRRLVQACNP